MFSFHPRSWCIFKSKFKWGVVDWVTKPVNGMAASFARYLGGKAVFSVCLLRADCADGLKVLGVGCVIMSPGAELIISSLITNIASKIERKELLRQCPTQVYTRLALVPILKPCPSIAVYFLWILGQYPWGIVIPYRDLVPNASIKWKQVADYFNALLQAYVINLFLMTICCLAKILSSYSRSKLRNLQGLPVRQSC